MSTVKELNHPSVPEGDLAIRVMAMPKDVNHNGDIFGGWLLSHMDLAAASCACRAAGCRTTTVAIDKMQFIAPVHIGDFICCYAKLLSTGKSSMKIQVQAWSMPQTQSSSERQIVADGIFTFVAIDEHKRPVPVFANHSES